MTRLPIVLLGVMRGLDPRISIQTAMPCLPDRDGRDKPGHDGNESYASADLAWPTMASNAAGSVMARSESTLRSTMMPALLKPAMKRL
jgi:hypothetical protein